MLAVGALAVVLATVGRWVAAGGPVHFVSDVCATSVGGRAIVASSDHLLTNVSLTSDSTSAVLDVEGRRVVVRGGEVAVDGATPWPIPPGCTRIDIRASGRVLRISADRQTIREVPR